MDEKMHKDGNYHNKFFNLYQLLSNNEMDAIIRSEYTHTLLCTI